MGLRAASREGWLVPLSMLINLVRSGALLPALALGAVLPLKGALRASQARPFSFGAPLEGALAVLGSSRFLALVLGLWLAGSILSGALRVLFLSGALPTLGARLAGEVAPRRFAAGVAFGFPRQLATWLLAVAVELTALGYLVAVGIATVQVGRAPFAEDHPVALAVAAGGMLTLGIAGIVFARVLGDAAAARAAILGERPAKAFAGGLRRFLARPGAFVLGGLAALLAALAVSVALQPAAGMVAAVAERLDGPVLLGPQLMLALLTALGWAAIQLLT